MSVLLISVVIIACCGVALLGFMFHRDDSRLGMVALGVLIAANVLAMVHAGYDA
ncbi:MAG: hypothetical protein ACRDP6_04250 [Actinoallomurus sp.]